MRTSILLVDDHKITRNGLSALIEKQPVNPCDTHLTA